MADQYSKAPSAGGTTSSNEAPAADRFAKRSGLFRPQDPNELLGSVLQKMLWDGRQIIDQERPRMEVNRKMYRGEQYLHVSKTGVRTLAPTDKLPNGVRRVTINRTRPFVDARIAMFTYKRPDFDVKSNGMSLQKLEARRIARMLVDSMWGHDGWDVDEYNRTALLYAEQDGLCYGHVYYDGTVGRAVEVMRDNATGQIIQDPSMIASYKETDPTGVALWTKDKVYEGDVKFRAVRVSSLSIDPFARSNPEDARWIIETEVMPRWKVETIAGMTIEEILRRSKQNQGTDVGGAANLEDSKTAYAFDDGDGTKTTISSKEALTVRHAYILPTGDFGRWPTGAHIIWIDAAPDWPILMEPYDRHELPYIPFCPRKDGGHFIKSRSVIDDLAPVQVAFNRVVSMIHEWLDLVGRPPVVVQNGVLRSKTLFNESRIININGGQPPFFMPVPSEPTAVLTHHLMWLLDQMKEIASQHDASRGQAPGKGIEAAVSLDMLIQQNEQTVSPFASSFKTFIERSVSKGLNLVSKHFTIPRLIAGAVGDDPSAFRDFVGSKIAGATTMVVEGPITPKARAAQVEILIQLAQYSQGKFDITKYVTQLLEGDIDEIIEGERRQLQKQKREIDKILSFAHLPNANQLWKDYQDLIVAYTRSMQELQAEGHENPMAEFRMRRLFPPTLRDVGLPMPPVEDEHNDALHVMVIDEFLISPAAEYQHPLVIEGLKLHRRDHLQKQAMLINSIEAQQSGADGGGPEGPPGQEGPPGEDGPPDESQQEGPPE